jgi:hypothetical protein
MIVRGGRIEESQEARIPGPSRARAHEAAGRCFLLALLATPLAADTAVVPTDFATIQAAVAAVEGTPDAFVRIDSDATFVERVTATRSVLIAAGEDFRPTLQGTTGHCELSGPCTIELLPTLANQVFRLRGLRLVPPAGVTPGSGGRHLLLFNLSGAPATLVIDDLEVVDPEEAGYDGIVSRVSASAPGNNEVTVRTTRIELRGPVGFSAAAIEMGEAGSLALTDSDVAKRGPSGGLLVFFGSQSIEMRESRFEVEAPQGPFGAELARTSGATSMLLAGNEIRLLDGAEGTAGGILFQVQPGLSSSLTLDSNRFSGTGEPGLGESAVLVQPFSGASATLTAVNNVLRGMNHGFELNTQGGTAYATITNNTIDSSSGDAVHVALFGGLVDAELFNNLFTRTGGGGIRFSPSWSGLIAFELGYNGYFENLGGAIDPQIEAQSTNDVFADPLFAADLRLRSGSPMIDRALDSAPQAPDADIEGIGRPVGPEYDIGAFEGEAPGSVLEIPTLGSGGLTLAALALGAVALGRLRSRRACIRNGRSNDERPEGARNGGVR